MTKEKVLMTLLVLIVLAFVLTSRSFVVTNFKMIDTAQLHFMLG